MPSKEDERQEESNLNHPDFEFKPGTVHNWRQQGYYIVCISCELQHALWVGENKILIGLDENGPLFKTRQELGLA